MKLRMKGGIQGRIGRQFMRWADEALDQAIQERRARWLSAFAIQAQPLRQEILLAIDECDPGSLEAKTHPAAELGRRKDPNYENHAGSAGDSGSD